MGKSLVWIYSIFMGLFTTLFIVWGMLCNNMVIASELNTQTLAVVSNEDQQQNPIRNRSNYTIYSSKQLVSIFPTADNKISEKWYQAQNDVTDWKSIYSNTSELKYNIKSVQTATGRITDYLTEQVVFGYYREDNHTYHIELKIDDSPFIELPALDEQWPNFKLAVGDLDGVLDAKGYPHDEIAVVYPGPSGNRLAILDHQLHQISSLELEKTSLEDLGMNIDMSSGDFDGNGIMEIAVIANGKLSVVYLRKEDHGYNAEVSDTASVYTVKQLSGGRIASGDFDGDKNDEIAIAYGYAHAYAPIYLNLQTIDIDSDLKITLKQSQTIASGSILGLGPCFDLGSGLFNFAPDKGFDINRRQLVVYYPVNYSMLGTQLTLAIFEVDLDLNFRKVGGYTYKIEGSMGEPCSMAVGNFLSFEKGKPRMDLAISYRVESPHISANLKILSCEENYELKETATLTLGEMNFDQAHYLPQDVPLTATDKDGNSFCLGSPAVIYIPQLIKTRYIMYEPPKHIDYLPDDPNDLNGSWSVVNVSRKKDMYITFGQGEERTQGVSTIDTTSYDTGSSTTYDAKESVTFGTKINSLKLSSEQKFVFGNSYSSSTKDVNSQYKTINYSYQDSTNIDDQLGYEIKATNIWRYPCYGLKDGDRFGFYEVVVPFTSPLQHSAGLSCADWYQPRHENGNILSYTYNELGQKFQPEDLGTFSIAGGETPVQDVLAQDSRTIDGNQGTVNLNWSEQSGSEKTKSYTSRLTKSTDISIGATAKVSIGWFSTEDSFTATFSSSENSSTSDSQVTTITNKTSKGITLQFPSDMDNDKAYHNDAAIYITKDGTMKVAYAVDPLGSQLGTHWWKSYYWKYPDPALNLPTKYLWINQKWEMNQDDTRKRMRGFYIHQKSPRSEFDNLLGTTLVDGDKVTLTARVYNYALNENSGDFRVAFSRVDFDPATGKQGDQRTLIGYAENVSLKPMEMQNVSVEWDTTGLGGASPEQSKQYVIYVTVDPDHKITNDFHPQIKNGEEFIGGNNEGYWPWNSGIAVFGKRTDSENALRTVKTKMDVSLHVHSLALQKTDGTLANESANIALGKVYSLRAHIVSTTHDPGYRHIHFYENDTLIASKLIFGLNQGDTYVWVDWIPSKKGKHVLSANVLEDHHDTMTNNNTDQLVVEVE